MRRLATSFSPGSEDFAAQIATRIYLMGDAGAPGPAGNRFSRR